VEQQHHHVTAEQWHRLAEEPEFRALVRARRRFVVPASLFFLLFYLALPISVGFAPRFMSRPVWGPLTLAYVFAILQFVMAWTLLAIYLRRAHTFDVHAARCRKHEAEEIRA
jgi:uncharacterized membrane protein (DUF485 family)